MGSYRERLLVPVSYWLLAIPVVLSLGAEAYFFVDGFIPPLVIVALYAIVAAFLVHWNSATIEVTGGVLRAGKDTLALSDVGEVIALDEKQAMALRGPRADPSAHHPAAPLPEAGRLRRPRGSGRGGALLDGGDAAPGAARGRDRDRAPAWWPPARRAPAWRLGVRGMMTHH